MCLANFENAETGETIEVELEYTGEVEYESFEPNEWDLAEAVLL